MTPSPLLALVLAVGLVGLTASPAAADDTAAEGVGRIFMGALVGAGGAAAGTLAGIGLARASRSELALKVLLPTSNLVTGLALEAYGAVTGHDGSALAASAASLGGQALGAAALFSGATGNDLTTAIVTTVVAQGVLASVVYVLTSEDEPAAGAQPGALLWYDPAHGLSVGALAGAITPDADGGYTVGLALAAGRF